MNICECSLVKIEKMLSSGQLSAFELVRAHLDRIKTEDGQIGAYLSVFEEQALQKAAALDGQSAEEKRKSSLWGIPFAAKDNICTKGSATTCASKMLENFISPYNATVIERLEGAGAVLLGKTNMDEFGMGNTTENSAFLKTVNPLCPDRVPGGSSGGSAAAVAAFEAPFALGSDTGGSVRQPAAFCGLVGLKPTYGALSRYGLVAFASSLEQVGILTRGAEDCALVFDRLAGKDVRDATSVQYDYSGLLSKVKVGVKGLRIGLPLSFFEERMDPMVKDAVLQTAAAFEKLGAVVDFVRLPLPREALAAYYLLSSAEASSNLARFDGLRYGHQSERGTNAEEKFSYSRAEGFGTEVKKRILFGSYVLSEGQREAYYLKAREVARGIKRAFSGVLSRYDLLLCPTAPTLPPFLGEKREDASFYDGDLFTVPANLAGIPALSFPAKKSVCGLPVGVQLMAGHGREDLLFRAALCYEEEAE